MRVGEGWPKAEPTKAANKVAEHTHPVCPLLSLTLVLCTSLHTSVRSAHASVCGLTSHYTTKESMRVQTSVRAILYCGRYESQKSNCVTFATKTNRFVSTLYAV